MYWSKLLPLPIVNFHKEGVKIQPVEATSHWEQLLFMMVKVYVIYQVVTVLLMYTLMA